MNTDRKTAAHADLAYLREMAEAGAKAPLLGGRFMVWWGGLTGLVAFVHWLIITGTLDFGAQALWPLWLGYMVLGSVGSAVLGWSLRNKPGTGSMGNRVQQVLWPVLGGMYRALLCRTGRRDGAGACTDRAGQHDDAGGVSGLWGGMDGRCAAVA